MSDEDYSQRCGSCAAFVRPRQAADGSRIGECALEVYEPPVRPTATCSRYRPKGAKQAAPVARVPGEPRGYRESAAPVERRSPIQAPRAQPRRAAIKDIDIDMDINDFRQVLREVLADELGIGEPELGNRWQGGELVLRPGNEDTQEKRVPIESFFHKIVMVRDKLRVLEAKLNGHKGLADEEKVQLQSYITACYGSLTTFNALFARREDSFSAK